MPLNRYQVHWHPQERTFAIHLACGHRLATIHPAPGVCPASREAYAGAEAVRQALESDGRIAERIKEILRAIE
jgi:hypothetical protein